MLELPTVARYHWVVRLEVDVLPVVSGWLGRLEAELRRAERDGRCDARHSSIQLFS